MRMIIGQQRTLCWAHVCPNHQLQRMQKIAGFNEIVRRKYWYTRLVMVYVELSEASISFLLPFFPPARDGDLIEAGSKIAYRAKSVMPRPALSLWLNGKSIKREKIEQ